MLVPLLCVPFVVQRLLSSNPQSVVEWTRFEDPAEHAFVVQVPQGWTVRGDLYRFGLIDPRPMIDMASPDGQINLRLGDANIPPYTILSRMMMATGFREGSPYNPGGRVQGMVANYRPGHLFAALYGQARFSPLGRHLEINKIAVHQPLTNTPLLPGQKINAGSAWFTWEGPQPMVGYVFAETSLMQYQGAGTWAVTHLFSLSAPAERAAYALKLLLQAVASVQMNPQWMAYQIRLSGQVTEAISQEGERASQARTQARLQEMQSREGAQEEIDNTIRGVTVTKDPLTGERLEVWSGQTSHTGSIHRACGLILHRTCRPGNPSGNSRTNRIELVSRAGTSTGLRISSMCSVAADADSGCSDFQRYSFQH